MPGVSRAATMLSLCAAIALGAGCDDDDEAGTTTPPAENTSPSAGGGYSSGGGGGDNEKAPVPKQTDARAIFEAVSAVLRGGDPDQACAELVTERFVREAYGDEQGCRAAQATQQPTPPLDEFERKEISGESAHVVVIPEGGPYDGVEVDVDLVSDGDLWKVDRLRADVPPGP